MKKRPSTTRAVVILSTILIGVGGAYLLRAADRDPVTLVERTGGGLSLAGSTRQTADLGPSAPASGRPPVPATRREAHGEAMRNPNPYALAMKLSAEKGPGTFALAAELDAMCRQAFGRSIAIMPILEGLQSAPRGLEMPVSNAGLSPEVQAKRVAATQEIQSRCQPFLPDRAATEPLTDDVAGKSFQDATSRLTLSRLKIAPVDGALDEIASQGMLASAWGAFAASDGGFNYFRGQPRGGLTDDEFLRTMRLGGLLATSSPPSGSADLRLLMSCAYSAVCGDDFAQIVVGDLPADSPSIARITSLAKQIAEALQARDVDAFRPPRK